MPVTGMSNCQLSLSVLVHQTSTDRPFLPRILGGPVNGIPLFLLEPWKLSHRQKASLVTKNFAWNLIFFKHKASQTKIICVKFPKSVLAWTKTGGGDTPHYI